MSRKYHLLKKFGITEEQYNDLLRKQSGHCGVCERPAVQFKSKLAVDHDHTTGEIRGLLCNYCNRWIVGRHRKGKGEVLLLKGYQYLNKEYTGWFVPPKVKKRKRNGKRKRKNRSS